MHKAGILFTALVLLAGCKEESDATSDMNLPVVNTAQCSKDTDCKGDRICDKGVCANPVTAGGVVDSPISTPNDVTPAAIEPAAPSSFSVQGTATYLNKGALEIFGENGSGEVVVKFAGKLIRDNGDYAVSQISGFNIGDHQMILLSAYSGGTACPVTYFIVDVDATGNAKTTQDFGSCSDADPTVRLDGDKITVTMQGFLGPYEPEEAQEAAARKKEVYTYRAGKLISA